MKLGICCSLENAKTAVDAGFDYVELAANVLASTDDFAPYEGLPLEATNLFFPSSVRLFGPDPFDWRTYAKRAVGAAASLGVPIMVVGSGTQRTASPDLSPLEAEARFVDMVFEIQEIATPYGIRIAPEALNGTETDVFTDFRKLSHDQNQRGLSYTLDIYHALVEWAAEHGDLSVVTRDFVAREITEKPVHVHFADLQRHIPDPSDSALKLCFERLRELGFNGRVSLEANGVMFDEALAQAQSNLRPLLNGSLF